MLLFAKKDPHIVVSFHILATDNQAGISTETIFKFEGRLEEEVFRAEQSRGFILLQNQGYQTHGVLHSFYSKHKLYFRGRGERNSSKDRQEGSSFLKHIENKGIQRKNITISS